MARLPDLSMIRIADLCFRWYQRFNAEKGDGHLPLLYGRCGRLGAHPLDKEGEIWGISNKVVIVIIRGEG